MLKKTLIINGSPRIEGNTAALIEELKKIWLVKWWNFLHLDQILLHV